jgi:DNA-directed RNA polymerase subunit RPC12/RpoP
MPIRFSCSKCSKKLTAPDKMAGKMAKCPDCATKTRIPGPKEKVAVGASAKDDPGFEVVEEGPAAPDPKQAKKPEPKGKKKALRPCPECEEMIPEKAVICRFCGAKFDLATKAQKIQEEEAAKKKKKQGGGGIVAVVLLIVIAAAGGAAYMYLNQ